MVCSLTQAKQKATGRAIDTIGDLVLRRRADFKAEKTDLEKLFISRGHILVITPKCHPELAGQGIEYSWGAAKLHYRRHNDVVPRNFHKNVLASLAILNRRHCFMFERRARAYRNAQKIDANDTFDKIEVCIKTYKAHRNAVDFDAKFIKSCMGDIEGYEAGSDEELVFSDSD